MYYVLKLEHTPFRYMYCRFIKHTGSATNNISLWVDGWKLIPIPNTI